MTIASQEVLLSLPDGRTLAYGSNGRKNSPLVALYLHGLFVYGNADRINPVIRSKNMHYVAPTLPGWGLTSPRPGKSSFAVELANDITFLLEHLYPDPAQREKLQIYVAGGSYGTVPAQILYGLPQELFPFAMQVKGMMLMGPMSPFRYHVEYTRDLTWANYIMVGPPAKFTPFRLLPRTMAMVMKSKFATLEGTEAFLKQTVFDKLDEEERVLFNQHRERRGQSEGEIEREWAEASMKSVSQSWEGFIEVSDVLYQDWGFEPKHVPSEGRRVLIAAAGGDDMSPESMARWLVSQYGNARLKTLRGGHIAALYSIDEIWADFLEGIHWEG